MRGRRVLKGGNFKLGRGRVREKKREREREREKKRERDGGQFPLAEAEK